VSGRSSLIGGIAAGLGVVGAVAVWFLKFRDGDGGAAPVGDDVARSGSSGVSRDPTPDEPHADDADSRDYRLTPHQSSEWRFSPSRRSCCADSAVQTASDRWGLARLLGRN